MKKFQSFLEYNILEESLNTPVEFHLTDDTQVPSGIYGIFSLDDDTYGMSLEQSDHKGIYILKMYRVLSKKPRKWSFKKPSHIRPALSTLLKFAESSVSLVKDQMKGILIPVSGKNTERYIKFAEKILKKSYITSFKFLPTTKSPDQKKYPWENIFVSKVGISPKQVFSDPKFKKYDFPEGVLTHEVSQKIDFKKPEKRTLKTEPSRKLKFRDFEVDEISIDSEVFDLVSKLEKDTTSVVSAKSDNTLPGYDSLSKNDKEQLEFFEKTEEKKKLIKFFKLMNENYLKTFIAVVLNELRGDPDALSTLTETQVEDILEEELIKDSFNKWPRFRDYLKEKEIIDFFTESFKKSDIKEVFDTIKNKKITKNEIISTIDTMKQYEKTISKKKSPMNLSDFLNKDEDRKVFKTNLDPEKLESTLPGTGEFSYEVKKNQLFRGGINSEDVTQMSVHIQDKLGYYDEIKNHENTKILKEYTNDGYKSTNFSIRKAFEILSSGKDTDKLLDSFKEEFKGDFGNTGKLVNMFDDITPLPVSMWVYRSTNLPKEIKESLEGGGVFVDPAVASTSLRNNLKFGDHKFRIFIPKGSNVLPVLRHSVYPTEKEVLLPPFSVIKIIRIDEFRAPGNDSSFYITGVFVGSVYKNFKEKFLNLSKNDLSEAKNRQNKIRKQDNGYDPADKYAVKTDAETLEQAKEFYKKIERDKKKK